MRPAVADGRVQQAPILMQQSKQLAGHLKQLSVSQVMKMMQISPKLAGTTHDLIASWTDNPKQQRAAIDSFLGDIYSGLQVLTWSEKDRQYADEHLRILSGLYGMLRPLDGIYPYRFEMGYKMPTAPAKTTYEYWADSVVKTLPAD